LLSLAGYLSGRTPTGWNHMRAALLAGLTVLSLSTLPARADEPANIAAPPAFDWQTTVTKAVAFEVLSSTLETSLFLAFYGGSAAMAGGVFAVSFASAGAVYILHDYLWEQVPATEEERRGAERIASKSVTYRIASTLRSVAIGGVLGGAGAATSAAFGATVAVADTILYAATEFTMETLLRRP
jgi:hypothetical protein